MKHSMILVAVLAAAALVAMVATRQLVVKQGAPQTERTETAEAGIQTGVRVVKERNAAFLDIVMVPKQDNVSVSTFTLDLTLANEDGDPLATAGTIKPDQALITESWSFPILSVIPSDSEGLVVKISGVHVATAPYQLTDRQVIATIPLVSPVEADDLVVTLGTEHTKFLTKDATPIPVDENVVVKGSAE